MCLAITESRVVWVSPQRKAGRFPPAPFKISSVSSIRSTSNGEGFTGTMTKSLAPRQPSVVCERNPGVSTITGPDREASWQAVSQALSVAFSITRTPPSARWRAARRAMERCGSASMMVGWRPARCQCTARQLASVLFPLPSFMVATVMIELTAALLAICEKRISPTKMILTICPMNSYVREGIYPDELQRRSLTGSIRFHVALLDDTAFIHAQPAGWQMQLGAIAIVVGNGD